MTTSRRSGRVPRPVRPAVIWPATKTCEGCNQPFSSASSIWVFESYIIKMRDGNPIVSGKQKVAVRWCPYCFTKNVAQVRPYIPPNSLK